MKLDLKNLDRSLLSFASQKEHGKGEEALVEAFEKAGETVAEMRDGVLEINLRSIICLLYTSPSPRDS